MTVTTSPAESVTITSSTKLSAILESVTCGRCGGSGRMPYSVMNGVCFKCGGTGSVYTKRGAAARGFYRSLARTAPEALVPGDKFVSEGFTAGTFTQPSRWVTVESVQDNAQVAADAGSYSEALRACGSAAIITDADKALAAAERGATLLARKPGEYAAFEGICVTAVSKNGERCSSTGSGSVQTTLDPAVKVAILKTAAEYQESLTKAGKPRKGSRWAA
jgi:hypothetical protein